MKRFRLAPPAAASLLLRSVSLLALFAAPSLFAQSGTVAGTVTDAETGEVLVGANVILVGTTIGGATDFDGNYRIARVPAGTQRFAATFLGHRTDTLSVEIPAGASAQLDFVLAPLAILGDGVEVTAQLEGQLAAINQQRRSNTIVNVVSQDRIRELPDQNAAESVGRLSGVSVQRDGGEGAKVQVRGLNPALSSVTINGERIPGTDGRDRSVDLSLISADLLAGIELFKALTPDKDADAIGGTVNLVVANARPGWRGDVRLQGGYSDLRNTFENVRINGTLSNRFFGERLGAILTANVQRADRSSDGFVNDYRDIQEPQRSSAIVQAIDEVRDRYGVGLTLDYDLGESGDLQVRSLYSRTDREDIRRRIRYRTTEADAERQFRTRQRTIDLVTVGLRGQHVFASLGGFGLTYNASLSQARNRTPDGFEVRFRQTVFTDEDGEQRNILPPNAETIPIDELNQGSLLSVGDAFLNTWRASRTSSDDRDVTASMDLLYPLRIGGASIEFRAGGKFRGKERVQDDTRLELLNNEIDEIDALPLNEIARLEGLPINAGGLALDPFINADVDSQPVLDGRLDLFEEIDLDMLQAIDSGYADQYVANPFFDRNDFTASEDVSAGYALAEVNAGPLLVVGGVRYEHTRTAYTGRVGDLIPGISQQFQSNPDAALRDTSGTASYGLFFPQVVSRVRLPWGFDVRAAATRTLARPDYLDLVFRENVNDNDDSVERGNPDVRPTTAWNYDLSVSQQSPYGLFSVGAFYKRLDDFFYDTTFRETEDEATLGYQVFETVNGNAATIYGVELEAQVNFTFLPGVLSGLLLNANYAYSVSEAEYPLQIPERYNELFQIIYREGTRTDRLPGQSPHVTNVSLGYERGGFSGRLSLNAQSEFLVLVPTPNYTFTFEDVDPETLAINASEQLPIDDLTQTFVFLDVQVTQEIPTPIGRRLRLVGSLNNLLNEREIDARSTGEIVSDRLFGVTGDLGLRLNF
ncbi:MAG: TonB-dependent receptor [Bacteroidota bacterium]